MESINLEDILEEDFRDLASKKRICIEENIKDLESKLIVRKKNIYQKIKDWFDYNKYNLLGGAVSSTLYLSLNRIINANLYYSNFYFNNNVEKLTIKNFLMPPEPIYFIPQAVFLLIPSYLNFIKNSEYFLSYLKKKNYFDLKAFSASILTLGIGVLGVYLIKNNEVLNELKYLKECVFAFSLSSSYVVYEAMKSVNNMLDRSKKILYNVSFKRKFSKISNEQLLKELDRLKKLEEDYVPALSGEKLAYYFELYKRKLTDFKSFTRELSLLSNRFYTSKKNEFFIIIGYLTSRYKDLFVKEYNDESSEFFRLLNKRTFLTNLNSFTKKVFDSKITKELDSDLNKLEKIILNTNEEGSELASLLLRGFFKNKPEDWKRVVEKAVEMKQYVIDKETKHSITFHLKDDLFSTDVFECKILKSEKELEAIIKEYCDIKFAHKAFSEELKQKPNNSVVEPLFLGRINFEGKEVIAMASMKRIIGKRADEFLRDIRNKGLSVYEENKNFIKEIINFQRVLTKRFYNEKYYPLEEFSNEEYFDLKFFQRLENLVNDKNFGSKELFREIEKTKKSSALKEFLDLEKEVNNPKYFVVVHVDAVTSNIIKYLKENKRIKISFTTFYDFKLMLASPNFDIYSYVEDPRNLLCENKKIKLISESYKEITKNKLFLGSENDFLKSYLLIQNLRDFCTGVMFIDYALNTSDQNEREYFLKNAKYFIQRNINNNYLFSKGINLKPKEAELLFNYENEFLKLKQELLNNMERMI